MIEKFWMIFFGKGWNYGETPTKRECFEAGWEACLKHMKDTGVKIAVQEHE